MQNEIANIKTEFCLVSNAETNKQILMDKQVLTG